MDKPISESSIAVNARDSGSRDRRSKSSLSDQIGSCRFTCSFLFTYQKRIWTDRYAAAGSGSIFHVQACPFVEDEYTDIQIFSYKSTRPLSDGILRCLNGEYLEKVM